MSTNPLTLVANPALPPVQDFYQLRREGIGFIANAASAHWTDYNVHDPGITLLEALCYAITDIGYRIDWDIADLLAPASPAPDPRQPYPNQAFFTARNILTVNPTTADDLRRLLIDLPAVRNAWLLRKDCACDVSYFAWCDQDQLTLSYQPLPHLNPAPKEAWALGLYEVLLELAEDPELGDLNDRMVVHTDATFHDSNGAPHPVIMELRFPDISVVDREAWRLFLDEDSFDDENAFDVALTLGAVKDFDVFTDPATATDPDAYLRNHWRNLFYVNFTITLHSPNNFPDKTITIEQATLRVIGDVAAKNAATATHWQELLEKTDAQGFIQRYRRKAKAIQDAITSAKEVLQAQRNLDEDYCLVTGVGIEDVAVCADVEVAPHADIERVQAQIWFAIEQYFSPSLRFRTLQELMNTGEAVEDIFDGPEMAHGFIEPGDLEAAALKAVLRSSAIITRLMAIDGIIAVNQLRLTKYDDMGVAVRGAADPTWPDGQPVFDPNQLSAAWLLYLSSRHQPRLYLNQSRFLFYKNGLPFLPRMDEATDTLQQLRGAAERPKTPGTDNDLPIPQGAYRHPDDYAPVQHSLPLAYGVGPAGLSSHASALRQAQAKDLKAYLMIYEQILGNALAQVAHTADLFSLDPEIRHTYFIKAFDDTVISGFKDIANTSMTPAAIEALIETVPEFQRRRNQFLDHLLARFGEQFNEYALLLTDAAGETVAQPRLIENKIAFLKQYPALSHNRYRAFDYSRDLNSPDNAPGLKRRIILLLGDAWAAGDRLIVVEHLLLRPKFIGDALYPTCCDGDDSPCGAEDPYSFRLTVVMPGWAPQYTENLNLRRFANRTIQQETPSHLLPKICWVGNDGFVENPCADIVGQIADLLLAESLTTERTAPSADTACSCANAIYHTFSAIFTGWYGDKKFAFLHVDALQALISALFQNDPDPADLSSDIVLDAALWQKVQERMTTYFVDIALHGWQFERFEWAWDKWLQANAMIDWTDERLPERVEAMLAAGLLTSSASSPTLCAYARTILTEYGRVYYEWMRDKITAGVAFEALAPFDPPAITLCAGMTFKAGTLEAIKALLDDRYTAYREPSYWLWIVVALLSGLRNLYPGATLHDCDSGSDQNPVRLDNTALGSAQYRTTLT